MKEKRVSSGSLSSFASGDSESTSASKKSKKKGFRKIGAIFGGRIRRRRKKKKSESQGAGDEGDNSSQDSFSLDHGSSNADSSSKKNLEQQEWIQGGGGGFAEMAAIGTGLSKITEEDYEDASSSDLKGDANVFRRRKSSSSSRSSRRRKLQQQEQQSSERSTGSSSSRSSFFGSKKKHTVSPDPLSLVVLMVEPVSLRFELLSLDFDLTTKQQQKQMRKRQTKRRIKKNAVPEELKLTVRDVLDQIQPSTLTDDKLKKRVADPGSCLALIDRRGTVHYGSASLETACAARPLRANHSKDDTMINNNSSLSSLNARNIHDNDDQSASTITSLLSVPTYSGTPHRDVLLAFFGTVDDESSSAGEHDTPLGDHTTNNSAVAKALELARPIFADPNVIGMMESTGYDLVGWKPDTNDGPSQKGVLLGKPLPPPVRTKPATEYRLLRTLLGLMVVMFATLSALVIVGGGLHVLPSLGSQLVPAKGGFFSETIENYANWVALSAGRVTLSAVDAVLGSDVVTYYSS